MDKSSKASTVLSGPKDKSLEVYKARTIEIAKWKLSEEEWKANGKEYWKERIGN